MIKNGQQLACNILNGGGGFWVGPVIKNWETDLHPRFKCTEVILEPRFCTPFFCSCGFSTEFFLRRNKMYYFSKAFLIIPPNIRAKCVKNIKDWIREVSAKAVMP